jgi:hypothetical protein
MALLVKVAYIPAESAESSPEKKTEYFLGL